jgi:hypothetical protein
MGRMMKEDEAAEYIGMAVGTLRQWRFRGVGPTYHKNPGVRGAVRYDSEDLDEFKEKCRKTSSVEDFVKQAMKRHGI